MSQEPFIEIDLLNVGQLLKRKKKKKKKRICSHLERTSSVRGANGISWKLFPFVKMLKKYGSEPP